MYACGLTHYFANKLFLPLLLRPEIFPGMDMPAKCHYKPSASRAISCRRPVVPRSIPVLSSSSLSRNELAVEESERSVTCPTFIGRPASSKPFSCSNAFFAHSASANFRKLKGYKVNPAANKKLPKTYKRLCLPIWSHILWIGQSRCPS